MGLTDDAGIVRRGRGRVASWVLASALVGLSPEAARAQSCAEPSFAAVTTWPVGTNPENVVIADVDRDGKLDLVTTNTSTGNVSVRRGQGDGTFLAVTNFPAGSLPHALAVADLNRDGRPDIVVSNNLVAGATVSVLLATGAAGNFGAPTSFPVGSQPIDLAVGDLDGDGKLDLAVTTPGSANRVSILLGDGNGGFAAGTPPAGLNPAFGLAMADFNRDGQADLAVAEFGQDRVAVLLATGPGTFGSPTRHTVPDQPEFVIAADFNRDGKADLAVSNDGASPKGITVLLGDGNGGFGPATTFPVFFSAVHLVAADFNRDGLLDVANGDAGGQTSVLLGRGDGSFGSPTTITTGTNTLGVAAGDLNGDGRPELAVAVAGSNSVAVAVNQTGLNCPNLSLAPAARTFASNGSSGSVTKGDFNGDGRMDAVALHTSSNNFSIVLNDGLGGFGTASIIGTGGSSPKHAVAADFNADGKLDLAITNNLNVAVLLGNGGGGFGGPLTNPLPGSPGTLAAGDLDRDGKLDLAVSLGTAGQVAILLGTGTGTFVAPTSVPVAGASLAGLALGDLDANGSLDLVVTDLTADNTRVLLGTGTGTFGPPTGFPVGTDPRWVALGDFDRDGTLDFATANSGSNDVSVRRGDGLGSFGSLLALAVGTSPECVAVGDLNGDAKPDLVAGGGSSFALAVLRGDGAGGFAPAASFSAPGTPVGITAGDFNRDGRDDVLAANGYGGAVQLLLGDGAGGITVAPRFGVGTTPRSVAAADFDGDGTLDIAASNFGSGNVSLLKGNGDGTFSPGTTLASSANSWGLATGDFNRDGKPDLAVAGFGDDKVRLFQGVGDGTFTVGSVLDSASRPVAIAVGDLNRDGRLDLVVANSSSHDVRVFLDDGLGSYIALTAVATGGNSPVDVALGDVNRDGILDVVTANQGSDDFSVLTGTGTGALNAPTRFTTGFQPSAVALGDLDRNGTLDVVTANRVSNHVTVYRGTGGGGFTLVTFFATGRLPGDVAIADVNADGRLDVVAASADFGSASVLLGDGTGSLGTAAHYGTGAGADALAVGDYNRDGKPDLATSVPTSGEVAVVLNTSCKPRRLLVTTDAPACVSPAGTVLSPALALRVVDDGSNVQQCGAAPVTASIVPGTGTAGAVLSGTNPVSTSSGVATFSNLSVNLEGRRYVLDFAHPSATAARSRRFTQVTPVGIFGPSAVCGSSGTWTSGPGYDTYQWKLDAATVATTSTANLTGLLPGPHLLELTCTQDTCPTLASLPFTVTATLSGVTVTPAGSTSFCASCTGPTLSEAHAGGGAVAWQWGFRTVSLGPITAIPGQTSQNYVLQGSHFPGPGTYYVVVTSTPSCGSPGVSNEVQVVVSVPPNEAQFFTVTSAHLQNTLEWVNPSVSGNVRIRFNSDPLSCTFPTDVDGLDGSTLLPTVPGVPGGRGVAVHDAVADPAIANDTHYCFTLWVDLGGSFSAGRTNRGRPFPTSGPVKWAFSLGTVALTPPGNGAGAVHVLGMDNSVHSAKKGVGGGTWPDVPPWMPRSMNGPSQGRPTSVPVAVGPSNPVLFLGSQDGHVYAFDARTGAPAWSPSSPSLGNVVQAGLSGIFTTFGGAFDYLLMGTRDGGLSNRFYALRPSNGSVAWSYDGNDGVTDHGKIGIISGQAAVDYAAKRVYFASRAFGPAPDDNTLWCFDLALERACWAKAYGDIDGGVTLREGRLYVGTTTGAVLAVNAGDGTPGWSFTPAVPDGPVKGYVVTDRLTDDVYFATSTRLWSLSDTGPTTFAHNWSPGGVPFTTPSTPVYAPGDTRVYVGGSGKVFRLSVVDGTEFDSFTLGDGSSIVGSPTLDLANGFAYVGSDAGVVYAIQLP